MVLFAVRVWKDEHLTNCVNSFSKNLLDKNVAFVMFRDHSFIGFVNNNVVVVFLDPIISKKVFLYIGALLLGMAIIFNVSTLYYIVGISFLFSLVLKYIIYFLFLKGLRKQGYKGVIEVI